MLADFFTKPLTGSLFSMMRDISQGLLPITELSNKHKIKNDKKTSDGESSGIHKECVEDWKNQIKNGSRMNEYTEPERNKPSYESKMRNEKIMSKIESENKCENKNRNENTTYEKYEMPEIHSFEKYEMSNNGEDTEAYESDMSQRYEKYGNNKDPKHNEETYACILKKNIFTEKYKLK